MRSWRENARHNTQCAHLRSKLVLATDASPRRPAIGRQFRNIDPVGPRWKRWGPKRNYPARPPKVGGHARGINRGDTRRNPQLTCRVSPEFCRTKRTIFTRTLRGMDPIPLVRPANAEGGDWRHSSRPCFWLFSRFRGGGWVGVCSRVFGIEPWVQSFLFFFRKIKTQFWKSACSKMGNSNWKDSSWTFWKIGFLQLSRGMEFVLLRNRIENWIWLYVCIYIYICSVFYFNLFLSLIRLIFFFFFRNWSSFVYSI